MGWSVYLKGPDGESVEVAPHTFGSNYAVGGYPLAETTITYNYGRSFRNAFDGKRFRDLLDGQRAGDVIPALELAVARLGTAQDTDYWASTDGNAGYALSVLLDWARQHPDAMFKVF